MQNYCDSRHMQLDSHLTAIRSSKNIEFELMTPHFVCEYLQRVNLAMQDHSVVRSDSEPLIFESRKVDFVQPRQG